MKTGYTILLFLFIFLISTCIPLHNSHAEEAYLGWEEDSPYNKLYNNQDRDSLKGVLVKFTEITPMKGMVAGTGFILREGNEEINVHLCPSSYANAKQTGLKTGEKTKVKGAWAVVSDKDVFMAAKVKQGESFEFKVRRTKDGTPFWTMSEEMLAQEKNQN
ncbi:hypothetical protein [Desulforhopalus sp. IMCC35007]|uniref:hypothetical protein n=1 Tax=Desulforhopalus sp. IMCC35007 TaxID=2569543 RepID=UPI0010AE0D46|nr:hypothetical protein [Desulforhopalus sp. IMCC35007]TKB09104.1 hypothetical protein FCL48_11575 [Desulforhopalus sp. IMCC35007]